MAIRRKIATAAGTFVCAVILFLMTALPLSAQLPPSKGAPKVGQKAPDFTLPDSTGNPVTLSSLRAGTPSVDGSMAEIRGQWVLLIFYRGYWCPFCNSELRSFQDDLQKFEARDVRVVALSVDSPEVTENLRKKEGYTFLFLCDPKAEVIRRWDLLHSHGGIEGADIARPAEFLIDPVGAIRWVNLTEDFRKRVHAPAVLKVLDDLHVGVPAAP